MVLVTTEYSMFDIVRLFSSSPMREAKIYRYDGGEFRDFDGVPPDDDLLQEILDKRDQLGFELQQ